MKDDEKQAEWKRPNILLITVDQMRGDCLSIRDHPVVETPNLDQLAREGVLFRNAYSATPSCVPARAAIFTGMSQRSHGRVGYQDKVAWTYEHTLPHELAQAGYHTQCIGKMHVYPTRSLCGFHHVELHDGYFTYLQAKQGKQAETVACDDYVLWLKDRAGASHELNDVGLDCNSSTMCRPWHLAEELHPTNWTVTRSIDFLRRRDPTKPFFLWMSFVRPHPPFDPPQAFYDMYRDADIPLPPVGEWANASDDSRNGLNPNTAKGIVPQQRLQRARAAYYALITHIDHQLGRFMQAMKEHGIAEDTIILFTSDHGDMLGDHHLFRKSLPYEGSSKIPFILSDKGNHLKLAQGSERLEVIELRDIMPTLLEVAGVDVPSCVDGTSVLSLAKEQTSTWRTYIHGEHAYGEQSNHYVTDGRTKYIWYSQSGREQLFDLIADPQERSDIGSEPESEELLSLFRTRLIIELSDREEGYVNQGQLVVGRTPVNGLSHVYT